MGLGRRTMIAIRTAVVDGLKLQYLTAGHGPAIVLLHGYAETSRMWRPLMPRLAEHFTVIAPDLPGIGGSDIPKDGLDMTRAGARIHSLVKALGVEKAAVIGHDIGLMVAYAYAAQFPAETEKLVLMDAFLPGVPGWEEIYNNPAIWHFRFSGPTPEALVKGRERTYFEHFWNDFAADRTKSIPEADRVALHHRVRQAGTHARGVGLFRLLPAGRDGFFAIGADEADDASSGHRRGESERRDAGKASEARRHQCVGRRPAEYRTLGSGGTAQGDDGGADEFPRRSAHFSGASLALPKIRLTPAAVRVNETPASPLGWQASDRQAQNSPPGARDDEGCRATAR